METFSLKMAKEGKRRCFTYTNNDEEASETRNLCATHELRSDRHEIQKAYTCVKGVRLALGSLA